MAEIVIRKRPLADGQSSQRKFYKKTARGKVLKVLRERYVRDDIQCGIEKCETCYSFTEGDASPLSSTGDLTHGQFPTGHFIIPDTNVFLHQMDLIESPLFTPPIIILQTVLDEVRHRSLPLHSRLKGLIASEDKQIYVFYNEFHAQTAVVRQLEESPNDRNDRGIRLSAAWYAKHYITAWGNRSSAEIVLLTDDAENRRRAAKEGIKTLSGGSFRFSMNRSVQGDLVVVELFPESEWKAPADAVIDADSAQRNDNPDDSASEGEHSDDEDAIQAKERQAARDTAARNPKEKQPTGRVVGVMKRNWRAYVCHIDRTSLSSTSSTLSVQSVFATPVDRALPRIRLRTRQAPDLLGQKILEGEKWVVPPKEDRLEWRDREDLRELIICSIDPPNCQDIDDALHARQLPNGNIEAGVHIADVSHFVHPDTPMDNEAASRGTTVYLVDKRIDMLPSLLGTNLCSLRPYVERLAFSAIWELTPDADIVNVRFTKSVIASKAAFTYEEAQIRKDDPTLNDELTRSIRLLNSLALQLNAKRMAAGALNLASPEVKIHLDSAESSDPIDVEQKELRETNSLVEEFMLLANVSVARQIQESFPGTAVLRRHMPPPHSNFEKLQDLLMRLKGMTLDVSSSGALAASLDKCVLIRRHRLAQMAGRASVEFYVGLALKARNLAQQDSQGVVEDAFVIRAFRNGLAVFVSKLGIEGLATFKNEQEFDPESYSITIPGLSGSVKIAVFDRVRVKIRVEQDKNTLRGKVKMTLLSPVDTTGL
ncbi:hypothetical protein RSAG8_04137, partial [Rhizoctonia solani AG-8 WAC10335]